MITVILILSSKLKQVLKEVHEMKTAAMDTSLFSPVYAVDSTPSPLPSPLTSPSMGRTFSRENIDDHCLEKEPEDLDVEDYEDDQESCIQGRLHPDGGSDSPTLTQLSTRIQLDIPSILDSPASDSSQGIFLKYM